MVTFIGYFIFCNFYATLTLCMALNCALHYVRSTFKAGQGEWPLLSGHRWYMWLTLN